MHVEYIVTSSYALSQVICIIYSTTNTVDAIFSRGSIRERPALWHQLTDAFALQTKLRY